MEICNRSLVHIPNEFLGTKSLFVKGLVNGLENAFPPVIETKKNRKILLELAKEGYDLSDYIRKEGFWCKTEDRAEFYKEFPFPKENSGNPDELFLFVKKLKFVQSKVVKQGYMGPSKCRICGVLNGTSSYISARYVWPEGYEHYLIGHNVQPTAGFVLYINELCERFSYA